jgi:uncharacterized repeat protein (TIGR03803 family)
MHFQFRPMIGSLLVLLAISLAVEVQAQTLTVLHTFAGAADGGTPLAGLSMDAHGNLYGTASRGGASYGTVYRLAHVGGGWVFTNLYTFQGPPNDGANPVARVILGPDQTLYGTTENGGNSINYCHGGCGSVFNLRPQPTVCKAALCPWQETVLYDFSTSDPSFGALPESEVTFDSAGNLYGTTYTGGYYDGAGGGSGCVECGLVYKLAPSNGGWTESVPYSFSGYQYYTDGAFPVGGVTFDNAGDMFGTTTGYGLCGFGIAYELTPNGSHWNEVILQQLCNSGASPTANLIFDGSGTFYGAAEGNTEYGAQPVTIFTLTQSGGSWVYTPIYTSTRHGGGPAGQLLLDSAGNLYGTTIEGGSNPLGQCSAGCGAIFKLSPSGGGWTYTELYDFTGGSDGAYPHSNLLMDAGGNLYGTASQGGNLGSGVVFEFTP